MPLAHHLLLLGWVAATVRASIVVTVPAPGSPSGEAHSQAAHLACSVGTIYIDSADYGSNYLPQGGTCTPNPSTPGCHCQCGGEHAKPPGSTVDVARKMAPVCNGRKTCDFPICWTVPSAGACAAPTAVALGDPCTQCFKTFRAIYSCSWGADFLLIVLLGVGA
eukprot:COSAG01_NODE_21327_length_907_cov_1.142327_1_plen_163_part_10